MQLSSAERFTILSSAILSSKTQEYVESVKHAGHYLEIKFAGDGPTVNLSIESLGDGVSLWMAKTRTPSVTIETFQDPKIAWEILQMSIFGDIVFK